jgi:hypothetical protein
VARCNRELCSIPPRISTCIHQKPHRKIDECLGNFSSTTPTILKAINKWNNCNIIKKYCIKKPHPNNSQTKLIQTQVCEFRIFQLSICLQPIWCRKGNQD